MRASPASAAGTDGFYGTGYAFGRTYGNLEGAFKADWNGNRIWVEDCHGDTYSGAVDGTVVYVASHAHDCARIGGFPDTTNPRVYSHGLAFTSAATRTLQPENGSYYDFGGQPAPDAAALVPRLHRRHLHRPEPGPVACCGGRELCRLRRGVPPGQQQAAGRLGALRPGRRRAQRRRSATERGGDGPDRVGQRRLDPAAVAGQPRSGQHPADLPALPRQRPDFPDHRGLHLLVHGRT